MSPARLPALPALRWEQLGHAVRELADPLRHASTEVWLAAAGEAVRQAVGAAAVTVFGPNDAVRPAASTHPPWALAAFNGHADALEAAGCSARALEAGVATRRQIYGPAYEALAASPYVREFLPSIGAHDAMTVAAGHAHGSVRVVLNADDPRRPFAPEDLAVARLLQPALAAGLFTERALGAARADLAALVDAAGTPCVVFDARGHRLHLSSALDDRLATEQRRDALLARAGDLARHAAGQPPFEGSRGLYTLTASQASLDGRPATVVAVGMPARAHGGRLTPRQRQVAEQLAQRRSNREIAAALGVSPHTARRHTEAVLRVLGVTDRRAVAEALGYAA